MSVRPFVGSTPHTRVSEIECFRMMCQHQHSACGRIIIIISNVNIGPLLVLTHSVHMAAAVISYYSNTPTSDVRNEKCEATESQEVANRINILIEH